MEFTTEKIPTWALCYLCNSDPTGLTDEDIETADRWWAENNVFSVSPSYDEEGNSHPYYDNYPAFGLPCDVEDCIVMTL